MSKFDAMRAGLTLLEFGVLTALSDRGAMMMCHLTRVCLGEHTRTFEKRIQRASRTLRKLKAVTVRKIAVVRNGCAHSADYWRLTKVGLKLAIEDREILRERLRYFSEDSGLATLRHTLATVDIEATLIDLASANIGFKLTKIQHEPKSWRKYTICGGTATLKPDMFAETKYKGKTDAWFFETDRRTEHVCKIIEKCRNYVDYVERTQDTEWKDRLPKIVIVAVDDIHKDKSAEIDRKERLTRHIAEKLGEYAGLFTVITSLEVAQTVLGGGSHG